MTDPDTTPPSHSHDGLLCPICRIDLVMSERQGIEIDYCPKCRGVWLDRGELDKIIERSASSANAASPAAEPNAEARPASSWDERDREIHHHHGGSHHGHGRRGFLGDIFD
jgi:Zn-finger nucleic acid-binding protein